MADQQLRVNLIGDATSLNRALASASRKLTAFGAKAEAIGLSLSTRISLPLALAGGSAIKFASDVEESMNKVDVAFGQSSDEVKKFAETALTSFGIARGQALDMTALFGDMATGMGISQKEASALSMELVGLAGDLSSFKNINIKEVTTALSGVFTGETESLKRLGIVMTEVNLKAFAMSKGITKNIKDMTQQEKIMLRLEYIMSVTANAQGDFARTSGSMANQVRQALGSIQQLAEELGKIMLPAATKVVKKINEMVKELRNLDDNAKRMIVTIGALAGAIPPVIYVFGRLLKRTNRIIAAIAAIGYAGYKNFDALIGFVVKTINKMISLYNEFYAIQIITDILRIGFEAVGLTLKLAFTDPVPVMRRFAEQISALYDQTLKYLNVVNKFLFDIQGLGDAFDEAHEAIHRTMTAFTEGSIFNIDSAKQDVKELENLISDLFKKIKTGELGKIEFVTKEDLIQPIDDFAAYIKQVMQDLSLNIFGEEAPKIDPEAMFEIGKFEYLSTRVGSIAKASVLMIGNSIDSAAQKLKRLQEFAVQNAVAIGQALTNSFRRLMDAKNPLKELKNMIIDFIKQLIAAAAAAFILSKILKALGGTEVFGEGATFGGMFKNILGVGQGLTLNPQATGGGIMPPSVSGFNNNVNVSGQFRLDGQDLVVSLERATAQRNNLLG